MNKYVKIGLYVTGVAAIIAASVYAYKQFSKTKTINSDEEADKIAQEVWKNAIKENKVKTTYTGAASPSSSSQVSVIPNDTITGKVSDAVNKHSDKELIGKKVYAAYANQSAYDTTNNIYTKTSNGQLMGTFAFSKPLTVGGKNVYIKTSDARYPYIYMRADFLKF